MSVEYRARLANLMERWGGIYELREHTGDQLVYKRQGWNLHIYIIRRQSESGSGGSISFESWCNQDPPATQTQFGCNLGKEAASQANYFQGSIPDPGGELCEIRNFPEVFEVNKNFGGSDSDAVRWENITEGFDLQHLEPESLEGCCQTMNLNIALTRAF